MGVQECCVSKDGLIELCHAKLAQQVVEGFAPIEEPRGHPDLMLQPRHLAIGLLENVEQRGKLTQSFEYPLPRKDALRSSELTWIKHLVEPKLILVTRGRNKASLAVPVSSIAYLPKQSRHSL